MVPSARLEAYSAFARGSPSSLLLFWLGKPFCLLRIVKPPERGLVERDRKYSIFYDHVQIV